jgi:hypothetical protein
MSVPEKLTMLANGNYHREPSLRAERVGRAVDLEAIQRDAMYVVENYLPSVVTTKGHHTNWTNPVGEVKQWSLWNSKGDPAMTAEDFNYVLPGRRAPEGTIVLNDFCSALPSLANMRLNLLGPGAALSPHEEHLVFILDDESVSIRCRFHLPLFTNDKARMMADGQWYKFEEGNVYAFNNGCVHAAENKGDEARYHLVWDMLMTEPAYRTMFEEGNDFIINDVGPAKKSTRKNVSEYAKSGGVPVASFDRRTLVFHR